MTKNPLIASDIAFTPAVKAIQARKGSRAAYARMEGGQGWSTAITPELAAFIAAQTSVFLGTANAAGQPYIQHRGGPPGFLRVRDERTIAFADLRGNRQFITQGNLAENPKAHLFLIDYATQQRIKLWGEARVVEGDAALLADLLPGRRQVPRRAGARIPGAGMGRELSQAHSPALRRDRRRARTRAARPAHRPARSGNQPSGGRTASRRRGLKAGRFADVCAKAGKRRAAEATTAPRRPPVVPLPRRSSGVVP